MLVQDTPRTSRILVIDDDEATCQLVAAGLNAQDVVATYSLSGRRGIQLAIEQEVDVVLTDLNLADGENGLEVCAELTRTLPGVPVIVITGHGCMDSVISALRVGAYDFITKPFEMVALASAVRRACNHRHLEQEVKRLRSRLGPQPHAGSMIGESQTMQRVYELISRACESDVSVLVSGESGTGKELAARALHSGSSRKAGPFVALNCAAMPATLLESELFGHVKGAFTDARTARKGLFLEANGGTIFLDEVGEMPIEMQPKLLRVLQERTVRPVGGQTESPIDVRVVAASNRDLEDEVEAGRFREDLYYRLNVIDVHLPPLRARGNDILLLAQFFLEAAAKNVGRAIDGIASDAAAQLLGYDWPGNVRQLENTMQRAVALTQFDKITANDLPERIRGHRSTRPDDSDPHPEHLFSLAELEHRYIEKVLKLLNGNKTQAAKILGVDRRSLYRKLQRHEDNSSNQSS
ncbi:MAG: hypothetical protein RJA70_3827 [Pseudomonadota bacterium]|jgi:two-component system response regulator HydG